jgi:16S rRNA processing protein RimM
LATGRVEVGFVARAHGIRGELVAVAHDPASETFASAEAVWIKGERYVIEDARATPKGWIVALEGIEDRDAADRLRGAVIEVDREELDLADGEVLVADLVGCAVVKGGAPWGTIVAIDPGPQMRLVIRDGDVEREVPLVDELVPAIDLEKRVVTVNLPDDWPEVSAGAGGEPRGRERGARASGAPPRRSGRGDDK